MANETTAGRERVWNWWGLATRAAVLGVAAVAYAMLALEFFGPRRDLESSWSAFIWVHVGTSAGALFVALGKRPRVGNIVLALAAAVAWAYLFIFIWFNAWGT